MVSFYTGILLFIAVIFTLISASIDLFTKIKRIIEERKFKKELQEINNELNKLFLEVAEEIKAEREKKKAEETKAKTTTRKRKQSNKKED